ncbi:transposase [Acetobacter senegalensis]|uniref:Transposase n=1 Tax=Acetobacter senegalensis TaxID=446692 RepID=A0A0U5EVX4_9PROT|nr:transposase [Acetobacter senegalensis]
MKRPVQRRELAVEAVAHHGVSIALACRIFGISETCFRYRPRLAAENDRIAALLVGLTQAHRRWGFTARRRSMTDHGHAQQRRDHPT